MRFLLSPAARAILVRLLKLVARRFASDATPPPAPAPVAPKRKGFLKRLFSLGRRATPVD